MIRRILKRLNDQKLTNKGYSNYYINFWSKEMEKSYKNSDLPKDQVKWAKKRGFKPFRIAQYGLNDSNYTEIISDDDYFWLYPLNPTNFLPFIDSKIAMKYAFSKFNDFLPEYYYHINRHGIILKFMDCPLDLNENAESVISLLEMKGKLAVKQSAGTYGEGFYKLEFDNNNYYVNKKEVSKDEMIAFIRELKDYIITEYIELHPELKKIYPDSVNTIRITFINEHGNDPMMPFAFMRFGTKASGVVDNTAQGGMFCKVDAETGRFYDAEIVTNHVITPVESHPDTGVKIDGILPNWDLVKKTIIDIGHYMPQLRWLGFDIAITQEGFKIIEINSHQGLHRAHLYPSEVKDFLKREVDKKKKIYSK